MIKIKFKKSPNDGIQLTLSEKQVDKFQRSVADLPKLMKKWDDTPPYQRGIVWDSADQSDLICSILSGIPVGSIHLVQWQNKNGHWVLDGKQRGTSIKKFMENKLSIGLIVDGKATNFNYENMAKSDNSEITSLLERLENYQLQLTIYDYMPFEEQAALFNKINYQKNLGICEKIYCSNFHTRLYLDYIVRNYFDGIQSNLANKQVRDNTRYGVYRIVHTVGFMSFGPMFNGVFDIRKADKSNLESSASSIHLECIKKGIVARSKHLSEDEFNDMVKILDIEYETQCLIDIVQQTSDILNFVKTDHRKNLNSIDVQDIMIFLMKKMQDKEVTPSFIHDNLVDFHKVFFGYVANRGNPQHSTDPSEVIRRMDSFQKLYIDNIKDTGVKGKKIPENIDTILRSTVTNCQRCGISLTSDTFTIDHINPSSTSSITDYQVLCRTCNSMKGNYSQKNEKFQIGISSSASVVNTNTEDFKDEDLKDEDLEDEDIFMGEKYVVKDNGAS